MIKPKLTDEEAIEYIRKLQAAEAESAAFQVSHDLWTIDGEYYFIPKPDMVSPKPDMVSPKPDMVSPKPDMVSPKPDKPKAPVAPGSWVGLAKAAPVLGMTVSALRKAVYRAAAKGGDIEISGIRFKLFGTHWRADVSGWVK